MRSPAWVCFEKGVDYFLGWLEGACCMQGKVATVVKLRSFFDENWLLLECSGGMAGMFRNFDTQNNDKYETEILKQIEWHKLTLLRLRSAPKPLQSSCNCVSVILACLSRCKTGLLVQCRYLLLDHKVAWWTETFINSAAFVGDKYDNKMGLGCKSWMPPNTKMQLLFVTVLTDVRRWMMDVSNKNANLALCFFTCCFRGLVWNFINTCCFAFALEWSTDLHKGT